jgi:hypothetical protein
MLFPIASNFPPFSLLFLQERVRDFFAAVDGRYDDEKGAAGDDEAELSVGDIAFFVYSVLGKK